MKQFLTMFTVLALAGFMGCGKENPVTSTKHNERPDSVVTTSTPEEVAKEYVATTLSQPLDSLYFFSVYTKEVTTNTYASNGTVRDLTKEYTQPNWLQTYECVLQEITIEEWELVHLTFEDVYPQ